MGGRGPSKTSQARLATTPPPRPRARPFPARDSSCAERPDRGITRETVRGERSERPHHLPESPAPPSPPEPVPSPSRRRGDRRRPAARRPRRRPRCHLPARSRPASRGPRAWCPAHPLVGAPEIRRDGAQVSRGGERERGTGGGDRGCDRPLPGKTASGGVAKCWNLSHLSSEVLPRRVAFCWGGALGFAHVLARRKSVQMHLKVVFNRFGVGE